MRSIVRVLSGLLTVACLASAARAQVVLQPRSAPPGRGRPAVAWKRLSPTVSPSPRAAFAMAYDPVSARVVLFGGYDETVYLNETWTFDGTTWTQQTPAVSPPPRAAGSMAYDQVSGRLVLFGGFDGNGYLGDTWLWNGANGSWENVASVTSAPAVTAPRLFTDPPSGRVTMFGGFDGRFYQATTWQWTGTDWIDLAPANAPGGRSSASVAVDLHNQQVVLSGGLTAINPFGTFLWDGLDWSRALTDTQPPLVYDGGAAYDPQRQHVILFGGGQGGTDINETWEWTGADWMPLATGHSPAAREAFGMVYDAAIGHIIVFGGQKSETTLFDDTWELSSR